MKLRISRCEQGIFFAEDENQGGYYSMPGEGLKMFIARTASKVAQNYDIPVWSLDLDINIELLDDIVGNLV